MPHRPKTRLPRGWFRSGSKSYWRKVQENIDCALAISAQGSFLQTRGSASLSLALGVSGLVLGLLDPRADQKPEERESRYKILFYSPSATDSTRAK